MMKKLRNKYFVVVDLNSGSYVIDKRGHEYLNLEKNYVDDRYYGYCPPHDGLNIAKMGGKRDDTSVSNVIVIYTSKIKGSNNREIIAFCDNATVHSQGIDDNRLKRILSDKPVTYSIESDYIYDLRDYSNKFIIDISQYSVYMFRKQRFYKDTYPKLDCKIYDYLEACIANIDIFDDMSFQNEIQNTDSFKSNSSNSTEEPTYSVNRNGKQVVKNGRVSKRALFNANYKCAGDENHITFQTERGSIYMEGHHLIPCTANNSEQFWRDSNINIDCEENIVCLCPTCHRLVHFGQLEDKRMLLNKIYTNQISKLNKIGIHLTIDELTDLY